MTYRLPLMQNTWGTDERQAMLDVFDSGFITMGKRVRQFEEEFADYVHAKHAIMVNSGSSALLLAAFWLREARPEFQVLSCPAVTWPTSAWPFMQAGFEIEFVDVRPDTLTANLSDIAVHLMGNYTDNWLVEDACEAIKPLTGAIGCYSFHFSHHMSTGEGGMVVTNDNTAADWLRSFRASGWSRNGSDTWRTMVERDNPDIDPRFLFPNWGVNVKPLELAGAIGSVQLKRLPAFNARRKELWETWKKQLPHPFVTMKETHPDVVPFALPIMAQDRDGKERLVHHLEAAGVETRPIAGGNLTRQPAMRRHRDKWTAGPLPGADHIHDCAIFVGLHPQMTDADMQYLIDVLGQVAEREAA